MPHSSRTTDLRRRWSCWINIFSIVKEKEIRQASARLLISKEIIMKQQYYPKMESAIRKISTQLQSESTQAITQETNIFRILSVENYEIRHAAFLTYLFDPNRNVELANEFWRAFFSSIAAITQKVVHEAISQASDIEISTIKGTGTYSEVHCSGKFIDFAAEIKADGVKHVVVIEYKHNGVASNPLKTYKKHIDKLYPTMAEKRKFFFIIEIGSRAKHKSKDGFSSFENSIIIEACRSLSTIASNKDMNLTASYIKQYLDILEPQNKGLPERYSGLEELLWDAWNIKYKQDDTDAAYFNEIINKAGLDVVDIDFLSGLSDDTLYTAKSYQKLISNNINAAFKPLSGWVKITPSLLNQKDLYIWTSIVEKGKGKYFIKLCVQIYQHNPTNSPEQKKFHTFTLKKLSKLYEIKESLDKLRNMSQIRLIEEEDGLNLLKRQSKSKLQCSVIVEKAFPISYAELKGFCTENKFDSAVFKNMEETLEEVVDIFNKY